MSEGASASDEGVSLSVEGVSLSDEGVSLSDQGVCIRRCGSEMSPRLSPCACSHNVHNSCIVWLVSWRHAGVRTRYYTLAIDVEP